MRLLISLLSILPLITWFFSKKRKNDIFSPINILTGLFILRETIPLIYYSNIDNTNLISNRLLRDSIQSDENFFIYTLLTVASYYLTILGIHMYAKHNNQKKKKQNKQKRVNSIIDEPINRKAIKIAGSILWIIGLIASIIAIQKIGGISFLLQNQYQRTTALRDMDIIIWLQSLLGYGIILIAYARNKKMTMPFIALIILTGIIQGMGARRQIIMLFVEALAIINYTGNRIKLKTILKTKYILAITAIFLIFIFLASLRTSNVSNNISENIGTELRGRNGLIGVISKESYVAHHMLTLEYFKSNKKWYGKTFFGLVTAIVPSSIYPEKPPVDDGTYLYSISLGRTDIDPPMSFKELNTSSYPLMTFSSMYSNFGIVGLFIGSIMKGIVIGYFYKKLKGKQNDIIYIYSYMITALYFELSTLNIFNTIMPILIIVLIINIIKVISRRSYNYAK